MLHTSLFYPNKPLRKTMTTATATLLLTLSLLLFLSLPTPSLSSKPLCHPQDRKILLQFKNSFTNPNPSLPSWNPNITTNCCEWYGVDCDLTTNRVTSLSIFSTNLSGQIPASIALLPSLQSLTLRKLPYLTGTIPAAIAKLSNLNMLRLSWTNLSGPVPSFLSQLKNLTFLDLAFNNLTGSIPIELDRLPHLDGIHLDRNRLTGQFPNWNFQSGIAPAIYLSHNQLTGPVPKSFGYYNYTTVDLSRNMLSGDLSFMFGSNKTVQIVDFSRNMFEFNLSNVVFPASLTSLDLNHNKIFGSLPVELTTLDFQYFNVSYNRLCGKIPAGGKLQSFDVTTYFHNRCLCGDPLPSC